MKYFVEKSSRTVKSRPSSGLQVDAINRKWLRDWTAYKKQLEKLEGRVSRQAWNFFYFGFGRWSLHDAHLLSFAAGDGLDFAGDGGHRFKYNDEKSKVRIMILNRHQNLLCTFSCNDIRRVFFNDPPEQAPWNWSRFDYLDRYELTSVNKRYLRLEFLFSSGATILVEFSRLKFSRQRVQTAAIHAGQEDMRTARTVSHDKVSRWLRSWGKKRELPAIVPSRNISRMKKRISGNRKPAARSSAAAKTIDEYLARVPEPARGILQKIRAAIRSAAPPETTEAISYGIPTFKYRGSLVWFAAFSKHCSLFPTASVIERYKKELKGFPTSKGTIKFTADKPLPIALVKKMVKARVRQIEIGQGG